MVLAASLLIVASASGTAQSSKLDEAIDRSNRIWYELPEVATTLSLADVTKSLSIREARRRGSAHMQIRVNGGLTQEVFDDRTRATILYHETKTYRDSESGPRTPYQELPVLTENRFDLRWDSTHGLILRARPALSIVRDERAARVADTTYRRLTARFRQRRTRDQEGQSIELRVLIDATGLVRRVEGEAETDGNGKLTFLFVCDPKVPSDEPFTYDVTKLVGWKKVEG